MEQVVVTRKQALEAGLKRYFTGVPCKRGHISQRLISTYGCVTCQRAAADAWIVLNPDKVKAQRNIWKSNNREAVNAAAKERRHNNIEAARLYDREWKRINYNPVKNAEVMKKRYRDNPEKYKVAAKKYVLENMPKVLAYQRGRKSNLRSQGTEHRAAIISFYNERQRISELTGVVHHVDHILPVAGKWLCGLHHPMNLRVIPAADNLAKHHKVDEMDLFFQERLMWQLNTGYPKPLVLKGFKNPELLAA